MQKSRGGGGGVGGGEVPSRRNGKCKSPGTGKYLVCVQVRRKANVLSIVRRVEKDRQGPGDIASW